jgi:hypothetical protein
LTASSRALFGNPNPSAAVPVWPMQHPEVATLIWIIAIFAVFVPLSIRLYRRESTS